MRSRPRPTTDPRVALFSKSRAAHPSASAALSKLALALLISLPTPLYLPATAQAENSIALPATVPAVREWRSGAGGFDLPATARIVASGGADAVAARFAGDLVRAGRDAVAASGPARAGDVVVRVDPSGPAAAESYRIEIGDTVTATARTDDGARHATQTLLQWFSQTTRIPQGVVTDWPDYPERGLSLDVGREYMTVGFLRQRIRELAYYRMNVLHLHLSDTGGFRLASSSHPEITAPQHYTKAEIADIVSYAAEYGVRVLPEIGFPAHMNGILGAHEELKLRAHSTSPVDAVTDGLLAGSTEGKIDISLPASRQLIEDLLREFVPLFPGDYFHIGGDEYIKDFSRYPQLTEYARASLGPEFTGEDAVASFFNWANGIVRSYGKTARMWNDGIPHGGRIPVDSSILVEYWAAGDGLLPWVGSGYTPADVVDGGHRIMNSGFTPTYWASGGYAAPLNAPPEVLYAWDPGLFVDGSRLRPDQRAMLTGSKLHVWCDDPTAMTEEQMVGPIRARLPIMAQQLWSGTGGAGYPEFTEYVRAVGIPSS
ncbi:beta-N-acetylhexosaminidase [Nocardia sp. 2]|uniref:beta-N-acetylhexosaminidase n=1 Tax=Nocardia acididurans TaxID=2802282 RepID=A0ABS1M5E7_9NOCA|nr:beta-N-acetylhexosaminidase [Nocardia acididurans]MBL1075815.1 beta-N-acetylhexosaminidase [Nocardia acididurans]